MFIELTEILRCPNDHPESYLVCVPVAMDGRRVVRGGIGCPVCGAEYPIIGGVAYFGGSGIGGRGAGGAHRRPPTPDPRPLDADALRAFINLEGDGGYAVLAGRLARLGEDLAALVPGVRFFGVNPPPGVEPSEAFSVLHSPRGLPVKSASVRAVALGEGCATGPWLAEGARVLLRGLRFVAENAGVAPDGIAELARGPGLFVGEKR